MRNPSLVDARDCAEQTLDGTLPYEETWHANASALLRALDALKLIAEFPEPLNNKNSALNQCAWLKSLAASGLVDSLLGKADE